ncbi:methyl-accepting chemotaxis protein [Aliivibrio kagoshimensis]|uniref:methyl-accepting chemotaxis protein n=1 Tax=Aliivibrio kagoshimensis TaxID=2910230 RepID=UPI003D126F1E
MFQKMGFKASIITCVVLIVTTVLIISNGLNYRALQTTTIDDVNSQSTSVINYEADTLERWFTSRINTVEKLASNNNNGTIDGQYVSAARLAKDLSGVSDIYFGFNDGTTYSTAKTHLYIDGVGIPEKYDPRTRDWYKMANATNGVAITDIYKDAGTKKLVISISKALNGGVILADIEMDILDETINNLNIPGAITAILDADGKAIASTSNVLSVGTTLSDIGLQNVYNNMTNVKFNMSEYTLAGMDKISLTREINIASGKKLYLFVGIEKSVVYSELDDQFVSAITMSIGMILLSVLTVVVILNILYKPIVALKDVVQDLAQGNGDLTQRLPVTSKDDLGQISAGINQFIANLQTLMLDISQSSVVIASSINNLEHHVTSNNEVLTSHSQEADQVATAIEEMSVTARDVASNAEEASCFSQSMSIQVETSKTSVGSAAITVSELAHNIQGSSDSIEAIERDTLAITKVLSVISDIADQTNLLALNAAIEAARAGEQGRGFAVVADEVRALAGKTRVSTEEIQKTLAQLTQGSSLAIDAMAITQTTCTNTVERSTTVEADLSAVVASVVQINDLNNQIATAAEEQSLVSGEIAMNMTAIREMAIKLSDNGKSTAEETMKLLQANGQLNEIVAKFKLQ